MSGLLILLLKLFRKIRPDLLIGFVLFMLPLSLFWQVTVGDKTLLPADNLYQYPPWSNYRAQLGVPVVPHNALLSDLVLENLEWKTFTRQAIVNRELPLWNPFLFSGTPFLAEGQHSALYPFSMIDYILPLDKAYGWFTVSQLWLAGILMYWFMRGLGSRRIGAVIAAIAYQLSAFFLASVVFQMVIAAAAWLPFLLLMVEFVIQRRHVLGKPTIIPWVALGGIGLGLCILAGHVEFLYYSLLVMGFWAFCRIGTQIPSALKDRIALLRLGQSAVSLIALVVIGIGIGAIQFVPLIELAGQNFRDGSASFDTVRGYAYPPRHALEFLMPNVYGSPAQHDYFDLFASAGQQSAIVQWMRPDGSTATDTYWEINKNYVEGACYVGLLTLILAAIAVLDTVRNHLNPFGGITTILALLSVISLAFVFGTPLYALLYYGLPGVNQLHSPFRWVFPLTLALAALAGFGADTLSQSHAKRWGEPFPIRAKNDIKNELMTIPTATFKMARSLGYGLIVAGLIVVLGLLLTRVFYAHIDGSITALLHKLAGANTQFSNAATFYSVEFPQVLLFGLFLIASGCVIRLSSCPIYLPRRLGRRPVWELFAVIVLALDLIVASHDFNPTADPAWLNFTPPPIAWLQAQNPQSWRFTVLEHNYHTLNANAGWLFGLQDIGGYDSIIAKSYVQAMQQIQPQGMLIYNRVAPLYVDRLDTLDSPLLNQLSVHYLITETGIDLSNKPQYQQMYQDAGVTIYANNKAWSRAVLLDTPTADTVSTATNGSAVITADSFNQVIVDVTTSISNQSVPVFLRLSDSYFPGWRAYLRPQGGADSDEHEIPITVGTANGRVVQVPPGLWTVRFRYSPVSVQVGAFGTFIAGILIVFMLLIWLWRRFNGAGAEAPGGVRRIAKNSVAPIILSLFNRAIDFGFAVVMLRVLPVTDVGIYYYAIVVIGWFDILTNFGLNTFLTRDVSRDPGAALFYVRRTSLLRLALTVFWLPALLAFLLIQPLHPTLDPTAILVISLLYLSLIPSSLNSGLSALFYAFEQAEIPAAVSTGTAIASVISRLGILLLGFGIIGLAGVSIALNVFTLILLSWQAVPLLRTVHAKYAVTNTTAVSRSTTREMILEAWPLMLNHLLSTIFFKIDVTLLEMIKGSDVVAQYSVSYKWVDAIGVIPSFFTMAMLPIMSRQARDDKLGLLRNYQLAVKLLVMVALPIAVVTTFLAPILVGILGGARYLPDGARALQLMIWFIPIGWINSLTQYVLIALDQQRPLKWPFVVGVIFNIGANLLFIPIFSYQAASVVTILSEIVLQIGFYILLQRTLGKIDWIVLLIRPVVAGAAMFGVLALLWNVSPLLALVVAGGTYPAALIGVRALGNAELSRLAPLLPGSLRRLARL